MLNIFSKAEELEGFTHSEYWSQISDAFSKNWAGSSTFWTIILIIAVVAAVAGLFAMKAGAVFNFIAQAIIGLFDAGRDKIYLAFRGESGIIYQLAEQNPAIGLHITRGEKNIQAGRFKIRGIEKGALNCSVAENSALDRLKPGEIVLCTFKARNFGDKKVNSFKAAFKSFARTDRPADSFTLEKPERFGLVWRRKYTRKRILEQEYVRVNAWMLKPDHPTETPDRHPDLAVNTYDTLEEAQLDNTVINISKQGLGLSVHETLPGSRKKPGTKMILNIFIFHPRKKAFTSYWYAGELRSSGPHEPGLKRLGIKLTHGRLETQEKNVFIWKELESKG